MADGERLEPVEGIVLPPMTDVVLQSSPFVAPRVLHVGPGSTVEDIVRSTGLSPGLGAHVQVFVGEDEIEPGVWHLVKPKLGAVVNVRVQLHGGGGGGKDVLRSVAMIAVMVVATMVAGPLATAALGFLAPIGASAGLLAAATAVAQITVATAGMLLANALIPPPGAKNQWGFDQELGNPYGQITGLRNQMVPYGPIPRVLGKRRMFPMLAGRPYTETQGNDQYLRLLLLVGMGPLAISDIKLGETPIGSYPGIEIETREGWPDDAPVTLYQKAIKEDGYAVVLDAAGTTTTKTTRLNTKEISIEIGFPSGVNRVDKGELRYHEASFTVQYRVAGSGGSWINADWLEPNSAYGTQTDGVLFVRDKTQAGLRRSGRWAVSPGQYEVKVTRTSATPVMGETSYAIFTTLRSIVDEEFLPTAGMSLIALRMKASGQLNGVPDQINCVAESYLPVYSPGPGTWAYQISRNPAWAFADLLRRRGTETINADSRIDLDTIVDWAADCASTPVNGAAPYWTFDGVLEGGSIFTALRTVASSGRASFTIRDGKYSVVRDVAQTVPVQHISPRNSWGYSGSKVFAEIPHALRIRFSNEDKLYAEDEVVVYRPGYSADGAGATDPATLFETLDMPGISRSSQAWREGMYHFAVLQLRTETHTVSMDVENLRCTLGSLVQFSHDAISVGLAHGRVKAVTISGPNITHITLDGPVQCDPGVTLGIRCRKADFATAALHIVNPASGSSVMTDTLQLVTPVAVASGPEVDDLFQFGERGLETAPMIVKRIAPGPDLTAVVSMTNAQEGIWTADQGTIPAFNSYITTPRPFERAQPPLPVIRLTSDSNTARYTADSTIIERIAVAFDPWPSAEIPVDSVEVQYRDLESPDFTPLPRQPRDTSGFFIDPVYAGAEYEVRARSVSPYGLTSEWVTAQIEAAGKTTAPDPITSLTASNGVGSQVGKITLNWGLPTDIDLWATEIWAATTNDRATATKVDAIADPGITYDHALAGTANRYYWARCVDLSGNTSTWFPSGATSGVLGQTRAIIGGDLDTTPPATPGTVTMSGSTVMNPDGTSLVSVTANWPDNSESDLAGYQVEWLAGGTSLGIRSVTSSIDTFVGATSGVSYEARVWAVDRLGNRSALNSFASRTAGQNTTAPSPIISGSVFATGNRQIRVNLKVPADADYSHAHIYRNTSGQSPDDVPQDPIGEVFGEFYVDANATIGTAYYYYARSVDRTGNEADTTTYLGTATAIYEDGRTRSYVTVGGSASSRWVRVARVQSSAGHGAARITLTTDGGGFTPSGTVFDVVSDWYRLGTITILSSSPGAPFLQVRLTKGTDEAYLDVQIPAHSTTGLGIEVTPLPNSGGTWAAHYVDDGTPGAQAICSGVLHDGSGNRFIGVISGYEGSSTSTVSSSGGGVQVNGTVGLRGTGDARLAENFINQTDWATYTGRTVGALNTAIDSNGYLQSGLHGSLTATDMMAGVQGAQLSSNPEFIGGSSSGYGVYNNAGGTKVTIAVVADEVAPNATKYILKISYDGTGTPSDNPQPGFGGMVQSLMPVPGGTLSRPRYYAKNTRVLYRVWAHIPVGRSIEEASNATGDQGAFVWLTPTAGTGGWKLYMGIRTIGWSGSFGDTGYFYISGGANTAFDWFIAKYEQIDITGASRNFIGRNLIDSTGTPRFDADLITADGTARYVYGQSDWVTDTSISPGTVVSRTQRLTSTGQIDFTYVEGPTRPANNAGTTLRLVPLDAHAVTDGNGAYRISGGYDWSLGGVVSRDWFTGSCSVGARNRGNNNHEVMFGLSDGGTSHYANLDYAFYWENGNLHAYESGAQAQGHLITAGTLTTDMDLRITYDGVRVQYLVDGVVKREATTTAGRAFRFAMSLPNADPLAGLRDITISAGVQVPRLGQNTYDDSNGALIGRTNLITSLGEARYVYGQSDWVTNNVLTPAVVDGRTQRLNQTTGQIDFAYVEGSTRPSNNAGTSGVLTVIGSYTTVIGNTVIKTSGTHGAWQGGVVGSAQRGSAFIRSSLVSVGGGGWWTNLLLDDSTGALTGTLYRARYISGSPTGSVDLWERDVNVGSVTGITATEASRMTLAYDGASVFVEIDGVRHISVTAPPGLRLWPKVLDFYNTGNSGYSHSDVQYGAWTENTLTGALLVPYNSQTVVNGNTATKVSGGDGSWGGGVTSRDKFTGSAFCSFRFSSGVRPYAMAGLADISFAGTYATLNYALFVENHPALSSVQVFASGEHVTTIAGLGEWLATDVWSIIYDGVRVQFLRNGDLRYTISTGVAAGQRLGFAASQVFFGGFITDIQVGPATSNVWAGIGGTGRPADNATVGAVVGTNLYDGGGNAYSTNRVLNDRYEGGVKLVQQPDGGQYNNPVSNRQGQIEIVLPFAWNAAAPMISFDVAIYDYTTGRTSTYTIGGYHYDTGSGYGWWYNVSATFNGPRAFSRPVRFGFNAAGKATVWIGVVNDYWQYPVVTVRNVQVGYASQSLDWATGWAVNLNNTAISSSYVNMTTPYWAHIVDVPRSGDQVFGEGVYEAPPGSELPGAGVVATRANTRTDQGMANTFRDQTNAATAPDYRVFNDRLENSITSIARPVGGVYNYGAGNITGYIRVVLPQPFGYQMISFDVVVDSYSVGGRVTYQVYGYAYNDGGVGVWINASVRAIGRRDWLKTVRFSKSADHSNRPCINIGLADQSWPYPKVEVLNVRVGHTPGTVADWEDGWVVGISTASMGTVDSEWLPSQIAPQAILSENVFEDAAQTIPVTRADYRTSEGTAHDFVDSSRFATATSISLADADVYAPWSALENRPTLTQGNALTEDQAMVDPTAWTVSACYFGGAIDGLWSGSIVNNAGVAGSFMSVRYVPLDRTKTYKIEGYIYADGALSTCYGGVALKDASGTNINGDGTYWLYNPSGIQPPLGTKTYYSTVFGAGTAHPFPSNATSMGIVGFPNYGAVGSGAYHAFSGWRIVEVPTWADVQSRPTELTDGRIVAGLASNGDVARNLPSGVLSGSNIMTRTGGGGNYTGAMDATRNTGELADRNTVTSAHIEDGAVGASELAVNAVDLASNKVTGKSLANIDSAAAEKLTAGLNSSGVALKLTGASGLTVGAGVTTALAGQPYTLQAGDAEAVSFPVTYGIPPLVIPAGADNLIAFTAAGDYYQTAPVGVTTTGFTGQARKKNPGSGGTPTSRTDDGSGDASAIGNASVHYRHKELSGVAQDGRYTATFQVRMKGSQAGSEPIVPNAMTVGFYGRQTSGGAWVLLASGNYTSPASLTLTTSTQSLIGTVNWTSWTPYSGSDPAGFEYKIEIISGYMANEMCLYDFTSVAWTELVGGTGATDVTALSDGRKLTYLVFPFAG